MRRLRNMLSSIPAAAVALIVVSGSALAAWLLGGFHITGNVVTTSGTPEIMELSRDLNYANDSIQYYSVIYQNENGPALMGFSCDMNLVSSDAGCTAEDWTDLQIEIKNGAGWDPCDPYNPPVSKSLISGENVIEYRIVQASNRCPLGAGSTYEITASI